MHKDKGIIFHPTNNQTLPTPNPFSTEEKFPKTTPRFKEFFNNVMTRQSIIRQSQVLP